MQQKRLRLRMLFFSMMILYIQTYSITIFNTAHHVVVIYKILDPLAVTVDSTEKLIVSAASKEPFLYSKSSSNRKPINIKIERPFNNRDSILDAIFSEATLELQNQGEFELSEIKDKTKKIGAKGFFSDNNTHKITIPLTFGGDANKYQGNTNLDVEFNGKRETIELGTYKGVLKVDVMYGG